MFEGVGIGGVFIVDCLSNVDDVFRVFVDVYEEGDFDVGVDVVVIDEVFCVVLIDFDGFEGDVYFFDFVE